MSSTVPYSHSSTPIMETWLIKALRLAHSKKPTDHERLRKFYREVCENEAMVSRITLNDALREPRDSSSAESTEKDSTFLSTTTQPATSSASGATNSSLVRIRPAQLITEQAFASNASTETTTSTVTTNTVGGSALPNPVTSLSVPDANATRVNKRTRVAFFNIFDATSPSTTAVTVVSKNSSVPPSPASATLRTQPSGGTNSGAPSSTYSTATTTSSMTQSMIGAVDLTGTNDSTTGTLESQCTVTVTELLHSVAISVVTNNVAGHSGTGSSVTSLDHVVGTAAHTTTTTTQTSTADEPTADAQLLASLVADLVCCVCGKLTRQAQLEPDGKTMNANMLVECVQCGALYHQMCHRPPVLSSVSTIKEQWRCGSCLPSDIIAVSIAPDVATASTTTIKTANLIMTPDTGPTVGARKRKAGLQSSFIGSNFRRM